MRISPAPVYTLGRHDIDRLEILEERSAYVQRLTSYSVKAWVTDDWHSRTQFKTDYQVWAWFEGDTLLSVGPPMMVIAVFWCENEAVEFARRMGHPCPVTHQSEADYQASVESAHSLFAEFLEKARANPEELRDLDEANPGALDALLERGVPEFPVTIEAFYGPGHQLPQCE